MTFFDDEHYIIAPEVGAGLRSRFMAWLSTAADCLEEADRREGEAWSKSLGRKLPAPTTEESELERFDSIVPDVDSEWRIPTYMRHVAKRLRDHRCLQGTPLEIEVVLAAEFEVVKDEVGSAEALLLLLESADLIAKHNP